MDVLDDRELWHHGRRHIVLRAPDALELVAAVLAGIATANPERTRALGLAVDFAPSVLLELRLAPARAVPQENIVQLSNVDRSTPPFDGCYLWRNRPTHWCSTQDTERRRVSASWEVCA